MTRLFLIVRAAIGLAAAASAAACETRQVSANTPTGTAGDSAEQVMYGARTVLASNGIRRGELSGDTVSTFDAATRFEFHGVHAVFMDSLGRPLSTLSAPRGTYRIANAGFEANGKVTVASDTSRRRLEGTAVRYDVMQNRLSSDSAFVATAGTRRLSGVGFTADPGLFTVKCLQQCTGSLGP
jgi:LPS export ABC transporter protein LptC